jgi:hypothetical protein
MKQIEITISPSGDTSLKTKGFAGSACKRETKEFEALLGNVTSDTPTEEARISESNVLSRKA